ncbi:MAG: TraR/DksA family transcriptional regulator [Deltaproteobacteria bacterium]|nr:TraR/DksA family transcriptional regulator [Deltaproteobacteria bacterium]
MKQPDRETIRKQLISLREDILEEIRRKNAEAAGLGDEGVGDMEDLGLIDNLGEFLHLLSDRKREEIILIDEALERLQEGTYGQCQECGNLIEDERLEVRPFARFCTACKARQEKEDHLKEGVAKGKL